MKSRYEASLSGEESATRRGPREPNDVEAASSVAPESAPNGRQPQPADEPAPGDAASSSAARGSPDTAPGSASPASPAAGGTAPAAPRAPSSSAQSTTDEGYRVNLPVFEG